jgi:NAD(P)-dependent dehydrogenase (short-subunit alcohol dehydrogenase family)
MMDFSDRVVMITGAGGNLGRAAAGAFDAAGANLVLVEHHVVAVSDILGRTEDHSRHLAVAPVDVTEAGAAQQIVDAAVERWGRIDVLVNTVGGYRAGKPVHETPVETLDFLFDLNVRSMFLMCQTAVPIMLVKNAGKIINVGASGGLQGGKGSAAYSAAKSAVIRITESLAAELKADGINVNCVLPSMIDTPQNRDAMPKADYSRWVQPASIADVILFLASDAARDIHGAALPVFGRV